MGKAETIKKWNQAIEKLERLTRKGELKWNPIAKQRLPRDSSGETGYTAHISGRKVLVYPYSFPAFTDEDERYLEEDVAIEFVEENLTLLYSWTDSHRGWRLGLLEAIRYEVSRADDFLEEFLSEPAESV